MKGYQWASTVACIAAAILSAPAHADAPKVDGNYMYSMCSAGDQLDSFGCLEFVAGWVEGMTTQAAIDNTHPPFCIPSRILYVQFRDIFVNYLAAHPEQRQYLATSLLTFSISQAFPCSTPSGK